MYTDLARLNQNKASYKQGSGNNILPSYGVLNNKKNVGFVKKSVCWDQRSHAIT